MKSFICTALFLLTGLVQAVPVTERGTDVHISQGDIQTANVTDTSPYPEDWWSDDTSNNYVDTDDSDIDGEVQADSLGHTILHNGLGNHFQWLLTTGSGNTKIGAGTVMGKHFAVINYHQAASLKLAFRQVGQKQYENKIEQIEIDLEGGTVWYDYSALNGDPVSTLFL